MTVGPLRARQSGEAGPILDDRLLLQGELEWLLEGEASELQAIRAALWQWVASTDEHAHTHVGRDGQPDAALDGDTSTKSNADGDEHVYADVGSDSNTHIHGHANPDADAHAHPWKYSRDHL